MTAKASRRRAAAAALGAPLLFACGSSDGNAAFNGVPVAPAGAEESPGSGSVGAGDDGDLNAPEREIEASFRAPVVTGKYVWSANPTSGRVAVIDAESYAVRSVEAGLMPTHVAAVVRPDDVPRALVINVGGNDATLLELGAGGALSARSVPLHQGADSWSVSPGGRFAIAWTDSRNAERLDPTDGFQDISAIDLDAAQPVTTRLTVGYRPSAIVFDTAGERAFAVTQDGIGIIELAGGEVRLARMVGLPNAPGRQPDVSIAPDGSRALARLPRSSLLYDIDLASGEMREIELGGELTDLDLSEDGTRAVAVVREPADASLPSPADAGSDASADAGTGSPDAAGPPQTPSGSLAVFIEVPAGLSDPAARRELRGEGESFGSVALSGDGARAVLFTTSRPSGRMLLVGPELEVRRVDLLAAVRAVFVTHDGANALVLQDPAPGSLRKGAFSVVSLANVRAPKLVAADAPAEAVALTPQVPERALVTVSDPEASVFGTFLVRFPNLQVDFAGLPSRPLATGAVPGAGKAFVAQQHPEGRITFVDLANGEGREITGFELSSQVVSQ